mmetsp:Transcript_11519/g.27344  ORF Transcript_11519/g.27344 Transcript_11519/m.27344 type:complete len:201 (+) Transcript_11519:1538-2140(+)
MSGTSPPAMRLSNRSTIFSIGDFMWSARRLRESFSSCSFSFASSASLLSLSSSFSERSATSAFFVFVIDIWLICTAGSPVMGSVSGHISSSTHFRWPEFFRDTLSCWQRNVCRFLKTVSMARLYSCSLCSSLLYRPSWNRDHIVSSLDSSSSRQCCTARSLALRSFPFWSKRNRKMGQLLYMATTLCMSVSLQGTVPSWS